MSATAANPPQENELAAALRTIAESLPTESQENAEQLMATFAEGGTVGSLYGVDGNRLEAVYSVAHTMYGNGKFADALTMFRFLTIMDYTEMRYWMGLGATQQMMGDYDAAVQAFAYATMLDMDDPKPQLQAGYCLLKMGQYEPARSALEGVLMADDLEPHMEVQAEALLNRIDHAELEDN